MVARQAARSLIPIQPLWQPHSGEILSMASISYQLYSSRKFDLDDTLAMVSNLGITQLEGYAALYADTDATRDKLETNGLTMPTGHFDFDVVETNPARCIKIAEALGIQTVVVPFICDGQGIPEIG